MTELSFRVGRGVVVLSSDGRVISVCHDDEPDTPFLLLAGEVRAVRDGQPLVWSPGPVEVDADEVEVGHRCGDLRLVVRHTFVAGWGLRVVLSNGGEAEQVLDDVVLAWRPAPGRPVWAVAAGAVGSVAILAAGPSGPMLGAVQRVGSLSRVDGDGLHLGRIVLAPGARYVEQWQVDLYEDPRSFSRAQDPAVPQRLDLLLEETTTVATTEDEALVLADGLGSDRVREGRELGAVLPGTYRVELRSARGSVLYQLRFAEAWDERLEGLAAAVLERPPTPAGVVPLSGIDEALVVQLALGRGLVADQYRAEDALDRYGVRLPEAGPLDPRTAFFLCGEHDRTADPEPLDMAVRAVLGAGRPVPGLGLAATRLSLALILAGQSVAPVLDRLRTLAADQPLAPSAGPLAEQAALLELEVVTMARAAAVPGAAVPGAGGVGGAARSAAPAEVVERTAALGGWLGAGLSGRAVPPLPVDQLAHLSAVLALLPEAVGTELRSRWGCTAHELAHRARVEVLNRLDARTPGPAHGWLVLTSRPG